MHKSTLIVGILFDLALMALVIVLSHIYIEGVWKYGIQVLVTLWAGIDIHSGIEAKIALDHRTRIESKVARVYLTIAYKLGNFLFERR